MKKRRYCTISSCFQYPISPLSLTPTSDIPPIPYPPPSLPPPFPTSILTPQPHLSLPPPDISTFPIPTSPPSPHPPLAATPTKPADLETFHGDFNAHRRDRVERAGRSDQTEEEERPPNEAKEQENQHSSIKYLDQQTWWGAKDSYLPLQNTRKGGTV